MADDYLGRKMEEYLARSASGQASRRPLVTLSRLLLKNRSHRGYDPRFIVREDQLRRIIGVNTRIPSARNQQVGPAWRTKRPGSWPKSASEGPCPSFIYRFREPGRTLSSSSARRFRKIVMSILIWVFRFRACCSRRLKSD